MRTKESSARVIFVRHGKTAFPLDRIYCDGEEDPPLNEEGQAQAAATASLLAEHTVSAIYTSPALRTSMTAARLGAATSLTVHPVAALKERCFGVWEGLYFNEIEERYPAEYLRWKQDKSGYAPPGGENIADVALRIRECLAGIVSRHPKQTVVVVSHVGPIRVSLALALDMPLEAYRRLTLDYCSMSRVDYGETQANIVYINRVAGSQG